jgi:hypothetical protein
MMRIDNTTGNVPDTEIGVSTVLRPGLLESAYSVHVPDVSWSTDMFLISAFLSALRGS